MRCSCGARANRGPRPTPRQTGGTHTVHTLSFSFALSRALFLSLFLSVSLFLSLFLCVSPSLFVSRYVSVCLCLSVCLVSLFLAVRALSPSVSLPSSLPPSLPSSRSLANKHIWDALIANLSETPKQAPNAQTLPQMLENKARIHQDKFQI